MNKMKVSGLSRKQNYSSRWETLIKKATGMLNQMLLLASKNTTPRNYILDQVRTMLACGVFSSAVKPCLFELFGYGGCCMQMGFLIQNVKRVVI